MKRRSFLRTSSALGVPALLGGIPVSAIAKSSLSNFINGDSDRILVLIQLNGGNDGLATIIPRDQQDNLAAVRPNILIPESSFINVTDTLAFHPNMTGLKTLYDNAQLNIIQSVGYPDQNRSHFRSSDIWHTGSASNEFLTTGWVGRYLDSQYPDYPAAYPNDECPDPFALTIGNSVSETCQGYAGNFSLAISNPQDLSQLAGPVNNEIADGCGAGHLDFLVTSIQQTNAYTEVLLEAYDAGNNLSTKYTDDNALAQKLKTVARLISGGLQTKIYVVSLGGFDTHADQTTDDDPTQGRHAELLQLLSDAICAFQDDLGLLNLDERVMGMTYSEFGRRIRSNFSYGTDHGTAAPLIVFGSCVQPGIIGDNPEISPDVSQQEGVPMQYDFRSVYGSVLIDWLEADESLIDTLFASHDFQYIPIASACLSSNTKNPWTEDSFLEAQPNPSSGRFHIAFESTHEWIKIEVYNAIGFLVEVLVNKTIPAGRHELTFDASQLPAGAYFVRMQTKQAQKTIRLMKQ